MSTHHIAEQETKERQAIYLKDYQVPDFLIDAIDLRIDLYETHALVISQLSIRHHRLSARHDKLILMGEELILESIKLNNVSLQPQQYQCDDKSLTILQVPNHFELEIVTKIFPQKNTALSGLYLSAKTYCTQCEPEGFRRITYFLDRPDVLARYTTTISADAATFPILLSNGNLIASGVLEQGRHWAQWEDPFKKPCYLFALVAGSFDLLEDQFVTQSGRDVILRIYVEKGYGDQAHYAMHALKEAMRWDEVAFGREYDLDIYMIVAIGDFNMGAMENKGLNIFNTKYVLAKPETATDRDYMHILSVIGHEYFHNWTGNRVTCRDWFQLSLKEGLTIFRDQTFTEDLLSRAVMRVHDVTALRETQFSEDASPLAHPVRPDSYIEINNFYTATIYNKGAEVLRMLQTILGAPLFRKGMDLYFARHDGQAATIENFLQVMEDVSGINLTQFRHWYDQIGTPVVTVQDQYDEKQKTYTLTLTQSEKNPLFIPVRMALLNQTGQALALIIEQQPPVEHEKVLYFTQQTQSFQFKEIAAKPLPSLFRNFSAPIKLQYPYTATDLLFLLKHDQDLFNRFEAGQNYFLKLILQLIRDYNDGKTLQVPTELADIFAYVLQHETQDLFYVSELLFLPSENYIGEQMAVVDVDAVHAVREFLNTMIAKQLETLWQETYHRYHQPGEVYQFNIQAAGKRQIKNLCLYYLMYLPGYDDLAMKQLTLSLKSNMTDAQAALATLANSDSTQRQTALDQFYATWKGDALVIDKWLSIQAASKLPTTLETVKHLVQHPAFDIKNPNKVYALIGTFGQRNIVNFHAINGAGYQFLAETVHALDKLNPQVAGRMVKPLTTWGRYDKERQALMRKQLAWLLQSKKLSTDLYELVSKSL